MEQVHTFPPLSLSFVLTYKKLLSVNSSPALKHQHRTKIGRFLSDTLCRHLNELFGPTQMRLQN
jgi:hypothetical protein